MPTLITRSPAETEALGERWGREAQSGWVIGLSGDLGAGKTQLVKGLARGLGITARVHSPTFTLVNEYGGGRLRLFHLDLYRLETREQIVAAGLEEYLQPDGVTVIEWAERLLGGEHRTSNIERPTSKSQISLRRVSIEVLKETERRITYEDFGA
jgi:tRNA threonylcarbamoyladenosine biosynthesis protein TsaE